MTTKEQKEIFQKENLKRLINGFMKLPRILTEEELNKVYAKLTDKDKNILLTCDVFGNHIDRTRFLNIIYKAQIMYVFLRMLSNGDIVFTTDIKTFDLYHENNQYKFKLKELQFNERSRKLTDDHYNTIYDYKFLDTKYNELKITDLERLIYKIIRVFETIIDWKFAHYARQLYYDNLKISNILNV